MVSKSFLTSLVLVSVVNSANAFDVQNTVKGFVGATAIATERPLGYGYENFAPDLGFLYNGKMDNWSLYLQLNYTGNEYVENFLTFGFLQYENSIGKVPFEVQVGKFRYEHGLFGGNLTNPRSRPALLAPQAIYFSPLQYNLRSAYGVKTDWYYGNFEFSASVGKAVSQNQDVESFMWLNVAPSRIPSNVSHFTPEFGGIYNFFIKHETEFNLFKMSYGQVHPSDAIGVEDFLIGDQITYDKFTLSAEAMVINPDVPGNSFFNTETINFGWSLTVGYEVTDNVKLSVNYNEYDLGKNSKRRLPNNRDKWQDLNVGLSYNATDSLLFRGEVHFINGSRIIPDPQTFTRDDYKDYAVGLFSVTYFFD